MTDNPTPNDIAMLREAVKPFLHAAEPILHNDGGRWEPDEWMARWKRVTVGHFRALHAAADAALAPGQHEEHEELKNRGAKLVIAYHVAICSPKGVVPDDEFYDPDMAADIQRMLDAGVPVKNIP